MVIDNLFAGTEDNLLKYRRQARTHSLLFVVETTANQPIASPLFSMKLVEMGMSLLNSSPVKARADSGWLTVQGFNARVFRECLPAAPFVHHS
jgi:hypothetical protein